MAKILCENCFTVEAQITIVVGRSGDATEGLCFDCIKEVIKDLRQHKVTGLWVEEASED